MIGFFSSLAGVSHAVGSLKCPKFMDFPLIIFIKTLCIILINITNKKLHKKDVFGSSAHIYEYMNVNCIDQSQNLSMTSSS